MSEMSAKIYREDILDIDLDNNGSLHRSFLNHAIGLGDTMENRFGVRLWRKGEPVSMNYATMQGIFMAPDGNNYAIVGNDYTAAGEDDGLPINVGWVQLPAICYATEGQFTLAIKAVSPEIVGTMRIIDGFVNNTGADDLENVDPPDTPSWAEVLAVWELMQECIYGSVRWDITQSIDATGRARARTNIESQLDVGLYIDSEGYMAQKITGDS